MTIMKFDEYLSSKGLVGKPVVSLDGDNIDPQTMPNTPPSGGKPYAAKNEKSKKSSKALGDEGDDALKYQPKVDNSKGKAPAKLPTVDEVTLAMKVAQAASEDPTVLETLVRQLKNNGLLGALVAETLNHRDTFKHISQIMAHESYGPVLCNKLVRAMNEEVAAPFSDQLSPEDEESPEDAEDAMDSGDDADMEDMDDMHDDDMDADMGDDDMDADMGDDDMGDMGDDDMGDMGDDDMGVDMSGGEEMGPPMDPNMMSDKPAMQAMMKAFMRRMMGKW
jgi:hypothetical protein